MIGQPRLTLRTDRATAVLDPGAGGRIAALRVDGRELLVTAGWGPLSWGAYPMVPWAGRLRDGLLRWHGETYRLPADLLPPHAIHGTLVERAWQVTAGTATSATLAAPLDGPWPFGGRAVHRVTIEPGALRAELEVHAGDRPFPAVVGWHPWFPRHLRSADGTFHGAPVEVELPAGGMLARGPDGLPDGTIVRPIPAGPWDDCFVELAAMPAVCWPGALRVTIESDAPCWVVYTERDEGVCVEPQTGPPDGLNTGDCTLVEPGRPLTATMTLRWELLAEG